MAVHKSKAQKHEQLKILYQDKDIVIISKPSGLLSVPYSGCRAHTVLDLLEKIMRSKGTYSQSHRPFAVHRLDRDTSGIMMFALNVRTQKKVMDSWHKMVTERLYHAVAENPKDKKLLLPDSGLIDEALAQNVFHKGYVPKNGNVKTEVARTYYRIILRGKTHTLFELSLDTGKKNQIRAHLASKGYPLAGDKNYRSRTDPFKRLALHARTLEFIHPYTGEKMRFELPESYEWIEYVKQGDSRSSYNSLSKVQAKHISAKQKSRLDFIAQGKLKLEK